MQEHCSSNSCTAQCSVPQDNIVLSCAQGAQVVHASDHVVRAVARAGHALGRTPPIQLGPVTTPKDYVATPNEPTLSRQGETLSRQTSVSHRGAAVATQNQLTMQHHYRDTKIVSQHQKTQLSRTLSRH